MLINSKLAYHHKFFITIVLFQFGIVNQVCTNTSVKFTFIGHHSKTFIVPSECDFISNSSQLFNQTF
ncbi:MAG: hypothetical protein LBC61_05595 [Candidatus Peribacteria bacterium]|nr:hypothetical protein [Candidatus Peribacteria bacterium]